MVKMKHLLPNIREVTSLSIKERIEKIRNEYWIGYSKAQEALSRMEELLNYPKRIRMPNMLLISPTNNGKTMIIEKFRRNNLPYTSENGEHEVIPVLKVQMPSNPSVRRFYAVIITELGVPVTYNSTAQCESICIKLMKATKVKMLIIDELHNILAGNNNIQREFLNVLRFIGNEMQIPIIGVGIKDAYLAIRSDDQLENRFEPFILPIWQNNNEFIKLLKSIIMILPLKKPSQLLDAEVRSMLLSKSEGSIGEIMTILIRAASEAIISGKEFIDLEILEKTKYNSPSERRRLYESVLN
jgi:hypothetical protein